MNVMFSIGHTVIQNDKYKVSTQRCPCTEQTRLKIPLTGENSQIDFFVHMHTNILSD